MDRLAALEKLLLETPGDPFLRYGIALEHARLGNRREAIARIENLLHDYPDYLGAFYQLGQWYEQEDLIEMAKEIYRRGMILAEHERNLKTLGELRSALDLLED